MLEETLPLNGFIAVNGPSLQNVLELPQSLLRNGRSLALARYPLLPMADIWSESAEFTAPPNGSVVAQDGACMNVVEPTRRRSAGS